MLHKQPRTRNQASKEIPNHMKLCPLHIINTQILFQEALNHHSGHAGEHHLSTTRIHDLVDVKVKVFEVKLGQNSPPNSLHVLQSQPTEGYEDHEPELEFKIQEPQKRGGEEQQEGSDYAPAFEGDEHKKWEERLGSQQSSLNIADKCLLGIIMVGKSKVFGEIWVQRILIVGRFKRWVFVEKRSG